MPITMTLLFREKGFRIFLFFQNFYFFQIKHRNGNKTRKIKFKLLQIYCDAPIYASQKSEEIADVSKTHRIVLLI